MIDETGKVEGNLLVIDDRLLHGMVTGSVTVTVSGYLELHGMVCGDLILEPGGIVALHGMVVGNVYNRGGDLDVYGTIRGSLHDEGGATVVDPDAIVGGFHNGQ